MSKKCINCKFLLKIYENKIITCFVCLWGQSIRKGLYKYRKCQVYEGREETNADKQK